MDDLDPAPDWDFASGEAFPGHPHVYGLPAALPGGGPAGVPYDQRPYQALGLPGTAGAVDVQCPGSLPPGYPSGCPRTVTLRDRRQVLIRPILPSDAPERGQAIKSADPDTLRRRFLGAPHRLLLPCWPT